MTKDSELHQATGFFRLGQHHDKFLIIDPKGQPFFLRGLNHAGDGTYMPWNLKERYGDVATWRASVRDRHRDWGFTFVPPSIGPSAVNPETIEGEVTPRKLVRRTPEWTGDAFAELDYPFTVFLEVPAQNVQGGRVPDVFEPAFQELVDKRCQELVEPLKDNPNLIGYHFSHNPPWHSHVAGFEQWIQETTKPGSAGLHEWMLLMRRIYGSIERWRQTYGIPINAWEDIEKLDKPLYGNVSYARMLADKQAFMHRICERWYSVLSDTVRTYDQNHLIFGDRNSLHLQPLPAYAVEIMGRYVDVLSINAMGPPEAVYGVLEQVTRYWDGPIQLGDFGTGCYEGESRKEGVDNRDLKEFERVYEGATEMGLDHPQIIGFTWCGYYESPPPFCRSGIVDCRDDEPLPDRLAIVEKLNAQMEKEFSERYAKG